GSGVGAVNKELSALSKTVRSFGEELQTAVPILATLGRAGPIGAAAVVVYGISRAMADVSKSIVQLNHTARELGLTTQELRAFQTVAEKAGIAPEAMTQGVVAFRRKMEDLKVNIGDVRNALDMAGFAELAERLRNAKDQTQQFKELWDMAEVRGRDSAAAKRMFEIAGLPIEALRFSYDEWQAEKANHPIISDEELARGKAYNALMVDLDRAWTNLKQKFVLGLFSSERWDEEKARLGQWFGPQAPIPEGSVGSGLSDV